MAADELAQRYLEVAPTESVDAGCTESCPGCGVCQPAPFGPDPCPVHFGFRDGCADCAAAYS